MALTNVNSLKKNNIQVIVFLQFGRHIVKSNICIFQQRTQIMREKVARYFPGDEQTGFSQYGLIQVSRTRKDYNNKWEIRTLKLTHTRVNITFLNV